MIIYLDEDNSYLSWISHHREGFVVDWLRQPTRRHPIIHRATCSKIRARESRKTHWTTGRRLKACSLDLSKLVNWAEQESGHRPNFCDECTPRKKLSPDERAQANQPTRMEKQILDYVLEVAVYHLDFPQTNYELTVGDIAECLDKTTGQIASALSRMIDNGYLITEPAAATKDAIQTNQAVYPTVLALRLEPAFEKQTDQEIEDELSGLRPADS